MIVMCHSLYWAVYELVDLMLKCIPGCLAGPPVSESGQAPLRIVDMYNAVPTALQAVGSLLCLGLFLLTKVW